MAKKTQLYVESQSRAQHQAALEICENLLNQVLDLVEEALVLVDHEWRIQLFNRSAEQLFGYQSAEILGEPLELLLPGGFVELQRQFSSPLADGAGEGPGTGIEGMALRAVHKNGHQLPVEISLSKFSQAGQAVFLLAIHDVRERKLIEIELWESEERFRAVFERAPVAIALEDMQGRLVISNSALACMLNCSPDELAQTGYRAFIHPDDLPLEEEMFQDLVANECAEVQTEKRLVLKDGQVLNVQISASVVRDESGTPQYAIVMLEDISKRRRAEAELQEREQQYRSIFESVSDGLIIYNPAGTIVEANPAAYRMNGYSYEEFIGMQPTEFIHPLNHYRFDEFIQTVQTEGKFESRAVNMRKDGTQFYVEVRGTQFLYKGKPHVLGVVRDISDRFQAYQLLEQRVEERTRELTTLLEISHDVASTLELNPLLRLILTQLKKGIDYSSANIFILEGDMLVNRLHEGQNPPGEAAPVRIPVAEAGELWEYMLRREPVSIDDTRQHAEMRIALFEELKDRKDSEKPAPTGAWLAVPLWVKDQVIGVISIQHSRPGYFSASHLQLAMAIANQAAIAIENARLYEQARQLAALQERQKLARELHDSVSQALYGIVLGARTAHTLMDRGNCESLGEPLDYILSLAEAGMAEMRALIFELRPESLEVEGLVAALGKHAAALQARYQIDVQAEFCDEPPIPMELKEAMYRIAQEALHNVIKHTHASLVDLSLFCAGGTLALKVRDNGQGFDVNQQFQGHLGLRSMRERAEHCGGTFQIESVIGEGTLVQVHLPLPVAVEGELPS
jgi:PAS domain S-box-containing protein